MAAKNPQPRQPGKTSKPSSPAKPKPGDGLMGWLGRQVGHVKQAVQTDVTKPLRPKKPGTQTRRDPSPTNSGRAQAARATSGAAKPAAARPGSSAAPASAEPEAPSVIVYRQDKIEEAEMPHQPGVKLRRTIIDEVIVVKKKT